MLSRKIPACGENSFRRLWRAVLPCMRHAFHAAVQRFESSLTAAGESTVRLPMFFITWRNGLR